MELSNPRNFPVPDPFCDKNECTFNPQRKRIYLFPNQTSLSNVARKLTKTASPRGEGPTLKFSGRIFIICRTGFNIRHYAFPQYPPAKHYW